MSKAGILTLSILVLLTLSIAPQAFAVTPSFTSVTNTSPATGSALTGSFVTLTGKVVTSPVVTYTKVQVYLRFWNAAHTTPNSTTVCPITNATATGTFSCNFQAVTPGLYTWNATAEGNPGGKNITATAATRNSAFFTFTATPIVYDLSLVAGWNLISLPLVPASTAIATVLASQVASGDFSAIYSYQGGKWYAASTTLAAIGTNPLLKTVQDGFGYWILMTKADTLYVLGNDFAPPPSLPPSYPLGVGWNLVGFTPEPTIGSETLASYLGSVSPNYDTAHVYLYENSLGTWTNTETSLSPGQAIWVYVTAASVLTP